MLVCIGCILFDEIHYYVMLPFYQECCLFQSLHFIKVLQYIQRRFYADFNSEKSDPQFSSRRPSHASRRQSMSRKFEQFKVVSVQMSWQHVRTYIKVWEVFRFPLQTCIWEDSYIRTDKVLNKARCGKELQSSKHQGNTFQTRCLLWKLRAIELKPSERYGNIV
jgi:hypothetical protein